MYEQLKIARDRYKLKWADCQTTGEASRRASMVVRVYQSSICLSTYFQLGYKPVFEIPYDLMFDGGERIHKKVPLAGGSKQVTLFLGQVEEILEKAKC
jgi:hypothetical protein